MNAPSMYILGFPELFQGLGKEKSDRDHHHEGLRKKSQSGLMKLTGVDHLVVV